MATTISTRLLRSDYASAPADQVNDQHNYGHDQQEMNEAAGDVKTKA